MLRTPKQSTIDILSPNLQTSQHPKVKPQSPTQTATHLNRKPTTKMRGQAADTVGHIQGIVVLSEADVGLLFPRLVKSSRLRREGPGFRASWFTACGKGLTVYRALLLLFRSFGGFRGCLCCFRVQSFVISGLKMLLSAVGFRAYRLYC